MRGYFTAVLELEEKYNLKNCRSTRFYNWQQNTDAIQSSTVRAKSSKNRSAHLPDCSNAEIWTQPKDMATTLSRHRTILTGQASSS